ncbi:hypothetical protein CEXT_3911 [Caerostris extrusa]|uniref:Uncharacterized protein n=1 Tax=Caerostris extrusa TaxID=172846 RepID=A0AAV4RHI0_CAEEX|nr:hypothetical protein CEXT_3911 [Caerostris extrusa]
MEMVWYGMIWKWYGMILFTPGAVERNRTRYRRQHHPPHPLCKRKSHHQAARWRVKVTKKKVDRSTGLNPISLTRDSKDGSGMDLLIPTARNSASNPTLSHECDDVVWCGVCGVVWCVWCGVCGVVWW